MSKVKELPPIVIIDLGDGWLHWHRTTKLEQILFKMYEENKEIFEKCLKN